MFKLLGKLPWFEWVGILAVAIAVMMVVSFVKNYGRLESNNTTLTSQNENLQTELVNERIVSKVTDGVVLQYNFERELKIQEVFGYQATTLEEYFATRDKYKPPTTREVHEKETSDVSNEASRPRQTTPSKPALVEADTAPDPAAIAVLATGMHRTYCRAYRDGDACPTLDTNN